MGNKATRAKSANRAVMLRVGRQFLRVNHAGNHRLISSVCEAVPDNGYTFWLVDEKAEEDTVDGREALLTTTRIEALRCGRVYHLCAKENFHTRPYSYQASFEKGQQAAADSSTWILREVPGDKFVLESYKFRGYCLSNKDGKMGLQRLGGARRAKHVTFYPIRDPNSQARLKETSCRRRPSEASSSADVCTPSSCRPPDDTSSSRRSSLASRSERSSSLSSSTASSIASCPNPPPIASSVRPTSIASSDRPTSIASSDRPTSIASSGRPTSIASSVRPTSIASSDRPTSIASSDRPTSIASSGRPTSIASFTGYSSGSHSSAPSSVCSCLVTSV